MSESNKKIIKSVFKLSNSILNLANLEARLARQTLPWIIALFLFIVIVLSFSWVAILAIVFYFFLTAGFSLLTCLGGILLINIITLLIFLTVLKRLNKNIRFSATYRQFKRWLG